MMAWAVHRICKGVEYECKFEKIDGLDDCPDFAGNGGAIRRVEVAEPAHSCGNICVVYRKARSSNWPELTEG
jgi:hypothetical protein